MSFDFFEQPDLPPPNNTDLVDIMRKIDKEDGFDLDFDFEHFEDPAPHSAVDHSLDSDFFPQENPQPTQKDSDKMQSAKSRDPSHEFEFQNSRDISEISMAEYSKNRSFKYQAPPSPTPPLDQTNQRYQNLQKLLTKAKGNSLDNFYKSLDQQQVYKNEEKFRNKEEFKHYRNQLKAYKKSLEEDYQARNGNYRFSHNHYSNQKEPQEQPSHNFKKKTSNGQQQNNFPNDYNEGRNFFDNPPSKTPQSNNPFNLSNPSAYVNPSFAPKPTTSTNFLPTNDFQDDGLGEYELKPEQIQRQIQKYQQQKYEQQAANFFSSEDARKQKPQRQGKKLETINQERANMFEVTHEEQKMKGMLNNYQELKNNFNQLKVYLQQNYTGQNQIIGELRQIKQDYENKESRMKLQEQTQQQKQQVKQMLKQEKIRKIEEISQKVDKIKTATDKDLVIEKLNQKVEGLEEMLRKAIQDLNQEKDPKIIPKIINYYAHPDPSQPSPSSRSSRRAPLDFDQDLPQQSLPERRLDQDFLQPVRNAVRQLRQDKQEREADFSEDYSSPLQLDLTVQDYPLSLSRGRSQQLQAPFVPPQGSREYQPNSLDLNNKNLRRCLTQKSSVLHQTFQFYVTGKFTVTSNERFPVSCEVRVANKCAINMYDVYVIVYGPMAQETELEMRPAKVMHDIFKHSTSFLFEVDLARHCLQSGHFSVQICYKSDPNAKTKKVNFKATLPFTHIIKPEFIYEEQFVNAWNHIEQEYFVRPRLLDFKSIRSHEDLKLILPFTEINQADPNCFSYGIMFTFPRLTTLFMLKVTCYVSGKASLHLKSSVESAIEKKLREQTLDILSFLIFG